MRDCGHDGRCWPADALAPYVARYRGRAALAFISLTIAAITTLVVPIAVRRMIDFGFSPEGIALINSYFSVMIAIVAVLAAASAAGVLVTHASAGFTTAVAEWVLGAMVDLSRGISDSVLAYRAGLAPTMAAILKCSLA